MQVEVREGKEGGWGVYSPGPGRASAVTRHLLGLPGQGVGLRRTWELAPPKDTENQFDSVQRSKQNEGGLAPGWEPLPSLWPWPGACSPGGSAKVGGQASGYRRRQDQVVPLEGWGSQDGSQRPAGRALTAVMRLGAAAEQAGARKGKSRWEGTCHPHTSQQLGLSPAAG